MRILLGVDLAIGGHDWLVDRASRFATRTGARIDLLYVAPDGDHHDTHRARLEAIRDGLPAAVRGEVEVTSGSPVDELIARTEHRELLIVGPREPGALERMFHGSMATRVIRGAHGTVLVPRGEPSRSDRPRVLVGLDLRREGLSDLVEIAKGWAVRLDGVLDAAFVEPNRLPYIADARVRAKARREWEAALEPDRRVIEELLTKVPRAHRGKTRLAEGQPEDALVELSEEYDLLLVGNRQRPGLAGFILGSVAEHVVRSAHCDVLTLPTASD